MVGEAPSLALALAHREMVALALCVPRGVGEPLAEGEAVAVAMVTVATAVGVCVAETLAQPLGVGLLLPVREGVVLALEVALPPPRRAPPPPPSPPLPAVPLMLGLPVPLPVAVEHALPVLEAVAEACGAVAVAETSIARVVVTLALEEAVAGALAEALPVWAGVEVAVAVAGGVGVSAEEGESVREGVAVAVGGAESVTVGVAVVEGEPVKVPMVGVEVALGLPLWLRVAPALEEALALSVALALLV